MAIIDEINTHSDEVHEILGTPPPWLLKWGSLSLLIILVLLAYGAFFTSYPESVFETIIITTENAPKKMVNETSGTISNLLVSDGDTVITGQILMVFKSPAKFEDILSLSDRLLSVKTAEIDSLLAYLVIPNDLILGEIQEPVFQFKRKQKDFLLNQSQEQEKLSITQLKAKIRKAKRDISFQKRQRDYITKQLKIVNDRYISAQNKYDKNLTTLDPVRALKEQVLQLEREIQETTSTIRGYRTDIDIMNNEIDNLESGSGKSYSQAATELSIAFNALQSSVDQWEKKYLLEAPTKGTVIFIDKSLGVNQFLPKESNIMVVLPLYEQNLIGRVLLDLKGSGKVKVNQKVIVSFDSYPSETFGVVRGEIKSKGKVAYQNSIPLEITFPEGLATSTGKIIQLNQEMTGVIEIITEEKRFIQWLFQR